MNCSHTPLFAKTSLQTLQVNIKIDMNEFNYN